MRIRTFVDEDKTEVVSSGVFLIYFTKGGCKVETTEE